MPPTTLSFFHLTRRSNPNHLQEDPYTINDYNAIKITAAILGVLCASIAIVMSVFMYQHYLRRQHLTLSVSQPVTHKRSTSSDALLLSIPEAQLEEQMADDVEANNIEEPPSPVMQQGLLQKELVRNYGSNSHPHRPTFLKPPPSHHS